MNDKLYLYFYFILYILSLVFIPLCPPVTRNMLVVVFFTLNNRSKLRLVYNCELSECFKLAKICLS